MTPATVKVETLNGVEDDALGLGEDPGAPPLKVKVPLMWIELRLRVPVAPATPFSLETAATLESSIVVSPGAELSRSLLKVLDGAVPEGGPPPK